ncbi:MAG: site-specific integrase [Methylotenera sp.]|jgi:integrase|nr:site-specific integrase [Methylotenera sp.]MDP1958952.1 site-specific integrase [Methylotenera sp.]MDP2404226.1 site-specific integrase [Methylotenera sp.]
MKKETAEKPKKKNHPGIRIRGDGSVEARIRMTGFPNVSKTFETEKEAINWRTDTRSDMRRGKYIDRREAETTTLLKMLEKYEKEVTPRKKSEDREKSRIKKWKTHKLASYTLAAIKPKDIATFRDERRKLKLAENTIRLDIAFISSVFEHCRKDWGIEVENPCRKIKLPSGSKKRERRVSDQEIEGLLEFLPKAMPRTKNTNELIELAIETGMRQSEVLGIEWNDVHTKEKYIQLDDTKSGDPRKVSLSPKAIKILDGMVRPIKSERVFKVTQDALIRGFNLACKLAKEDKKDDKNIKFGFMDNLKFHDLRHEAASRWASELQAQELCKMFGWKTMQMALRYYHPTALSIADKLAAIK